MALDMAVNPVSICAFVLTCLGCVQCSAAIFVSNWWNSTFSDGTRIYHGVWSREVCTGKGSCITKSGNVLAGGQETAFVSKLFACFSVVLSVVAVVANLIYFCLRRPMIRTAAIFAVGAAGVFSLLAVFIFLGFYLNISVDASLGAAFYLFTIGGLFCVAAAAVTAWASVRKARTMF